VIRRKKEETSERGEKWADKVQMHTQNKKQPSRAEVVACRGLQQALAQPRHNHEGKQSGITHTNEEAGGVGARRVFSSSVLRHHSLFRGGCMRAAGLHDHPMMA
jgi:hypothetical protein